MAKNLAKITPTKLAMADADAQTTRALLEAASRSGSRCCLERGLLVEEARQTRVPQQSRTPRPPRPA